MELVLGHLRAQRERPQTSKFSLPTVVFPELFASARHLTILAGYLVTLGWEVYLLDVHPSSEPSPVQKQVSGSAFTALVDRVKTAVDAIESDIIAAGHGLGGLLALKLAETPKVRAAVALAPLIPGVRSHLFIRRNCWPFRGSAKNRLPSARKMLELVAEAEPFQREALIKALVPMDTSATLEVARGAVEFAADPTPRMIIAGGADALAPWRRAAQFASEIDARFISLPGRGHWLIAGRALERSVSHMQRFLVQALGEELLLLYQQGSDGGEPEV
jgi:pimeloyl-ACP methyl ester carboxylesterase